MNRTAAHDFVMRNKGILRLINQSQAESDAINFRTFKKSDNVETSYVSNLRSENSTVALKLRKT